MLNLGMFDYRKRLEAERRADDWNLLVDDALETLAKYRAELDEANATIARLQDLVAKFQRGGVSTLYAEGHMG